MAYQRSVFIHRRDLRLEDNTGLIAALRSSREVVPCFILDPRQLESNRYKSLNAIQFMTESIEDLDGQYKKHGSGLSLLEGEPEEILSTLLKDEGIEAVYLNRDYTPFSRGRDKKIGGTCKKLGVNFHSHPDYLLNEPEAVLKSDGTPYTVFTPFYRRSAALGVRDETRIGSGLYKKFTRKPVSSDGVIDLRDSLLPETNEKIKVRGGRSRGLQVLKQLKNLRDYERNRDYPALDETSHLSAHNKFGTCSIREVHRRIKESLGPAHPLIRQLYWRDFFTHIGYHFPRIYRGAFRERYDNIRWRNDKGAFKKWREGKTGFPIVDAGMRELNTTGFMHNRVRMIVSSFLTKDLHIDWGWGERYFAQKLVDYDPAVNNGNWQWAASTGCDAQPYFRIFNPWLQQKKFDPECTYIKKWVPELGGAKAKEIHNPYRNGMEVKGYPAPMVDHAVESAVSKSIYSSVYKEKK